MIATSDFQTALECTKFVFGRGSAPDPVGELTALPRAPRWFHGALLLRGREARENGYMGRKGNGRGGEGRKGEGEKESRNALRQFLRTPLVLLTI